MKNEKKETAVEWLFSYMFNPSHPHEEQFELLKQAKEMEKERMKGMYVEGSFAKMRYYDGLEYIDADQYYNETHGGSEQ